MLSGTRKLFINGLSNKITRNDIIAYFKARCDILDCVIIIDKSSKQSRGFGFITVLNNEKVKDILSSQHIIKGNELECKEAKPKEFNRKNRTHERIHDLSLQNKKIFVGGLPASCNKIMLANFFSKYGEVEYSVVMTDKATDKPRGFGFVVFKDSSTVDIALNDTQNHYILGKWVECKRASPKESKDLDEFNNNGTCSDCNSNIINNNCTNVNNNTFTDYIGKSKGRRMNQKFEKNYVTINSQMNPYQFTGRGNAQFLDETEGRNANIDSMLIQSDNIQNITQADRSVFYCGNVCNYMNENPLSVGNPSCYTMLTNAFLATNFGEGYEEQNHYPQKEKKSFIENRKNKPEINSVLYNNNNSLGNNYSFNISSQPIQNLSDEFENFFSYRLRKMNINNYLRYKLFDKNGEEIKNKVYQKSTKVNLFKNESESTIDSCSSSSNVNFKNKKSESQMETLSNNSSTLSLCSDYKESDSIPELYSPKNCFGPRLHKPKFHCSRRYQPY